MSPVCGNCGLLRIAPKISPVALASARRLFTRLLLLSEHRGPLASGAAWLDASGCHRVYKAPLPASEFVTTPDYEAWQDSVPSTAVLLMGHTRWLTMGSHLDNRNNHPLSDRSVRAGRTGCRTILLTHNGHLTNVQHYFEHFGLPRRWAVDSELLLRLARRHAGPDGINTPALLADIGQCPGHIASVAVWAAHPETILFIRRDRPLYLAFHARRRLVAYASERGILGAAISGQAGWRIRAMRENTALLFRTDAWGKLEEYAMP